MLQLVTDALFSQTIKGRSVAIGVQSLYSLNRTNQDDYNVAIGYRSITLLLQEYSMSL